MADDPVAVLTGDEDLEVADGDRAVPDAPARNPSQEEVPHDAGIPEQMAKKQGPWPSSNRTQVERDAMWRAAPGAEDLNQETEDISPAEPEDAAELTSEPAAAKMDVVREVEEMCQRAAKDLDTIRELKDQLDTVAEKARKVASNSLVPETIQRLQDSVAKQGEPTKHRRQLFSKLASPRRVPLLPSVKRAARIIKKAGWPKDAPSKGIGLPTEVRPVNQAFVDDVNAMSKAADDWDDQGWWYEKEFKLASNRREPFKTALFLELAGTGERDHQFTTADTDNGVMVKVDRTEKGLNPQFTKMANKVYETFDPMKLPVVQMVEQRKIAGEIRVMIVRKTMIPQDEHVCPHCEKAIGEKESFWPEEFRDHPTMMIMRHNPCGGLYSQKRMSHQELMEKIPGKQPGEWHTHTKEDLNDDPTGNIDWNKMLDKVYERRGECPRCTRMYHECECSDDERPEWPDSAAALIKELTKAAGDQMDGGVADDRPDDAFDPEALAEGTRVEAEHTEDADLAKEIAKDHLAEDPRYYDALEATETLLEKTAADKLEFCPNAAFRDIWRDAVTKAKDEADISFDLENDEPDEGAMRSFSIKAHSDATPTKFRVQLAHAGGDWENPVMYFRVQLTDGFVDGRSSHRKECYFCLIPPKGKTNPNLEKHKGKSVSTHNDGNDNQTTDASKAAAWKWVKRELESMVRKERSKYAAEKPFRRRVEVIITDGLNVWGQKQEPSKGGVWFPGGGVDARDEKFADAAAREVIEESGFEVDEIYRLARIKPCECVWDQSVLDQASGKWEQKAKQYKGDRTHMYVATVKSSGAPTSREGDAMSGEWMRFSTAIRKLRNAVPHDNQGWKPLTRARLRAVEMLAPSGLKVPRRGEVDEVFEEVDDG